ncbi:hypothetical protein Glove_707g78 [Diversispora epigaea]|uniref:Uncharacterized protein n=1 Tax=Diversispora epigaea TaxID=1348612 RepID=A0A397G1J6_9GLOM|nr:hypothetical protein Glove_707g78 [Diversispora epigaea]
MSTSAKPQAFSTSSDLKTKKHEIKIHWKIFSENDKKSEKYGHAFSSIVYEELIIINEKLSLVEGVPPTFASTSGTSGASTQGRDAEVIENVPPPQKEQSIPSGFRNLQLGHPSKIWVKYGNNQPTKIDFNGEDIHDLKRAIKNELPNQLGDVDVNQITLIRHGEEEELRADLTVDENFVNAYDIPLQVIVDAPVTSKRKREESLEILSEITKSTVREELSQKSVNIIKASNLSDSKARDIVGRLGLTFVNILEKAYKPIEPISCKPFVWDNEINEDHQMSEVIKWFKNALNLPKDFHVQDIHKQTSLTGGADISIGPSGTPCVWVETKKKEESLKESKAIGELFIIDKLFPTKTMSVLTDCKDNWVIYYFSEVENKQQYLTSSKIENRGIALAIIKQFVLGEWGSANQLAGSNIIYQTNLPIPLRKKAKLESIPEEVVDDRISDVINDMTDKELFNMSMRNRLKLAKNFVRTEEEPIMDQFIRQFSDDYENSPPQMFA